MPFLSALDSKSLVSDHLQFGDEASEQAHELCSNGKVISEKISTVMGAITAKHSVRTLQGLNSSLDISLTRRDSSSSLILEIQEIHDRRPRAFGYTVAVNGQKVYFRTYEEVGAGPNHYFIQLPRGENIKNILTITSASSAPFSLGQIWLYENFFTTIEPQEKVYKPLALMGMKATAPEAGGPGRDFAPFGEYRDVNFLNMPKNAIHTRIDNHLDNSAQTGRPVQILLNGTTWGGSPRSPDGQGGYFTDIRYSQLAYDLASKSWSPCYPNMWSCSFWTSSFDPLLQTTMRTRFLAAMSGIQDKVDFLHARGLMPYPVYVRELGPPMGEVTAATIQAATKEGIKLDPTDGLDKAERQWLHQNDVWLWQEYASWHAEVFGRDSVIVDRGAIRLPAMQTIDNQYAHTVFSSDHGPLKDRRYFGGQVGMVEGFWSSGEVFFDKYNLYDYVKANGKLAHVNIWAPFTKDSSHLRSLYDAGFQFATFIGDTAETTKVIRASDGCADLPALLPPHHQPILLEVRYNTQRTLGPTEQVVGVENLSIHSQSREVADMASMSRLAVNDLTKPGQITYRIDNGGIPFATGLSLQLDGRIAPGTGNRIQVLLGETPNNLQQVALLNAENLPCPDHWELFMTSKTSVNLGEKLLGKNSGFLRLVFHAEGAFDATFLMELSVTGQWNQGTGHVTGNPFTMREQRTLNLWIQERVVAQRLLKRYTQLAGEDHVTAQAKIMMTNGRYRTLQALLSGAISQILPARYVVRGHGELGRHKLNISLPNEDQVLKVTLLKVSEREYEFSVTCDVVAQPFTISLPTKNGTPWSLSRLKENHFRLQQEDSGKLIAVEGCIRISAEAVRENSSPRKLPTTIIARYLEGNRSAIRVDSQDMGLMDGEENISLQVTNGVTVTRHADLMENAGVSKTWPERFDRVVLSLNEQGKVTGIDAKYGHAHGKVVNYTPFSAFPPYSNGMITLDNGNTYEFDFITEVETTALHGIARAYESKMLLAALRPGMEVTIDYSPYTESGTSRRIIKVSQSHQVLMTQDYTTMLDNEWRTNVVSTEGVVVKNHNPEPHNGEKYSMLMRPAKGFEPGTVIYKVVSEWPVSYTVLEFSARVYDDSSSIDFEVSRDEGKTWNMCGRYDNTWQNCFPQGVKPWKVPWQYVDLTSEVQGVREFYLRLTLRANPADDRMALGKIRVVTEIKK